MTEYPKAAARRTAPKAVQAGYLPEALHEYRDAHGNILYGRIRLKRPDGRQWIRPMYLNARGDEIGKSETCVENRCLVCLNRLRFLLILAGSGAIPSIMPYNGRNYIGLSAFSVARR